MKTKLLIIFSLIACFSIAQTPQLKGSYYPTATQKSKSQIKGVATLDVNNVLNGYYPLDSLGGNVDLSNYYTKPETQSFISSNYPNKTEVSNEISDSISGLKSSLLIEKFIFQNSTNVTKQFTLSQTPTQVERVTVTNSDIFEDNSEFSISGNTLRILSDLENNSVVRIWYWHGQTNSGVYTKAESDGLFYDKTDGENLSQTVISIADGTGGKAYPNLTIAMAVLPLPANGTIFTIDSSNATEKGVYAYDSTQGSGYRFVSKLFEITGLVQSGNTDAVSGGEVYKSIESIFVKNLVKWKPQASQSTLYDFRDLVTNFKLNLTSDFRKPNGELRKIQIRALSKSTTTLLTSINLEIEDNSGVFVQIGTQTTATDNIIYNTSYGTINISFGTVLPPGAGTPATYTNSGINPNLISFAQQAYSDNYNKKVFSLLETNVVDEISIGYISATGVFTPSTNWISTTDFIEVVQGEPLGYVGRTNIGGAARAVCGYDENGVFIEVILNSVNATEKMTFSISNPLVKKIKASSYNDTPLKIFKISGGGTSEVSKKKMGKTWRAVGMSIWASDETTYSGYQTLIKQQYTFTGYSKYCYSGNSLGGLTSGDTSSVLNKSGWVGTADDIWTLDTSTNDFKRDIPIGTISDYTDNTGITTFYGALRVFKDKVATLSPNATIITSNALKRNNAGYTSTSTNSVGATLLDYEKAIMAVSALNGWYFVDQYRMSGITDESLTITTTDGLHLNNFGYTLAYLPWLPIFEHVYQKQF